MYSEDAFIVRSLSGSGHASQQGTTVSTADLFLTQPSLGQFQLHTIPHNVAPAAYSFVAYPAFDDVFQGLAESHHPVQVTQSIPVIDVSARYFNGPLMPSGRMSRGPSMGCEWVSEDGAGCGQTITGGTVPEHLASHGIRGMHKDCMVLCHWRGCWAYFKRHGITRHVREVHLGLKRKSHRRALAQVDVCS